MGTVRVVHIIDHLGLGGVQTLLQTMLPQLPAHGYMPAVVNLRRPTDISHALEAAGVPVYSLGLPKWSPRQLPALIAMLQHLQPQVVHTHLTVSSLLGRFAAIVNNVPHLVMEEQVSLSQDVFSVPPLVVLAYRLSEAFLSRYTSVYLGPSQLVLEASREAKRWPAERCMVRPNAVDCNRFQPPPSRSAARLALGLPDRMTVATFGRFVPQKRITDVIELARRLVPKYPHVQFLIAGGGPQEAAIRTAIATAGIEDHVQLLGHRSDTDRILAAADIYLSVSGGEVLSLAILEAMASGCALVATRAGGTAEQIAHGRNGFLASVGDLERLEDALASLFANPKQCIAFGVAGRTIALERFDVPAVAAAQAAVYRRLGSK